MSLCIVAACQSKGKPSVVLSHDWKFTQGDASSENTDKFAFIKPGWPVVSAGDTSHMDLMGTIYYDHFASVEITEDILDNELEVARGKFKYAMIDRFLRGSLGIGYDEFRTKGKRIFLK